ncbi:MAG: hypothetical protein R3E31_16050 [Chloroflexota bacterium]
MGCGIIHGAAAGNGRFATDVDATANPEQKNERLLGFSVGLGWFLVDHEDTFFAGHNGGIIGFAPAPICAFAREGISAVLFVTGMRCQSRTNWRWLLCGL